MSLAKCLSSQSRRAPDTELKYFHLRARGEATRIMYAAAGQSKRLTDTRYPMDLGRFSEGIEVASPEFAQARGRGELKANLNRVPVLVSGGVEIGQQTAIERYVARVLGLYGSTELEGALIDMVVEHLADIKQSYHSAKAQGEQAASSWLNASLHEWLLKLEDTLGGEGYAVGTKLSWADIKLWSFVTEYFDERGPVQAAVKLCPKVAASVKAVSTNPRVAAYLAARPETAFL